MGIFHRIAQGSKNHVLNALAAGGVSATTASFMLSLFRKSAGNLHVFYFFNLLVLRRNRQLNVKGPSPTSASK